MKKSKFAEEQIAYALARSRAPPAHVYRQLGVSEATFCIWKKTYAHLGVSELCKLRSLETRTRSSSASSRTHARQAYAREAVEKKGLRPRAGAHCGLVSRDLWRQGAAGLPPRSVQSHRMRSPKHGARPTAVASADSRVRAGRDLALSGSGAAATRGLVGKWEARETPVSVGSSAIGCGCGVASTSPCIGGPAPVPTGPTGRWSKDVVHDALANGRPFPVDTVVDQWSRLAPAI